MMELPKNTGLNKKLTEAIAFLITEKGISYFDIFGEEIEGEIDGKKFKIIRKGMPISALTTLLEFQERFQKEINRKIKKR